jgi:hypothetical protein
MQRTHGEFAIRFAVAMLISAALLGGCSPSSQTTTTDRTKDYEEQVREAEAGFHPSDHDPLPAQRESPDSHNNDTLLANARDQSPSSTSAEMAQGFRVQVYSTTHIDRASAQKAELETMFPDEWFYLDYESPSYRIRAGNFLTRLDADRFARLMNEKGYVDAWVVPERVYKVIGKRPAPPPAPPTEPTPEEK